MQLAGGGGAGADRGHLVQGDAGGYAGVEGFGTGGDGDADQDVAGLGDDAGQAAALGADDQGQRGCLAALRLLSSTVTAESIRHLRAHRVARTPTSS